MKLYSAAGSRYAARVLIQISAKKLPVTVQELPNPFPADFLTKNPLGLVPVLETANGSLPEANVICEYLEDLNIGPSLRPDDARARAQMRLIIRQYELYADPALDMLYKAWRSNPSLPLEASLIGRSWRQFRAGLQLLENVLTGTCYALESRLTLTDCALLPPLFQSTLLYAALGADHPFADMPNLFSYFNATQLDRHISQALQDMEPPLRGFFASMRLEK